MGHEDQPQCGPGPAGPSANGNVAPADRARRVPGCSRLITMSDFHPGDVVRMASTSPQAPDKDWTVIATYREWVWMECGAAPISLPADFLVLVGKPSTENQDNA